MTERGLDPTWQESIDAVLLERLLSPLATPGVLSLSLVRRIFAVADYFSGRLPLLQELSQRRGGAGALRSNEVPIVHARALATATFGVEVSARTVVKERVIVQAGPAPGAARQPAGAATSAPPGPASRAPRPAPAIPAVLPGVTSTTPLVPLPASAALVALPSAAVASAESPPPPAAPHLVPVTPRSPVHAPIQRSSLAAEAASVPTAQAPANAVRALDPSMPVRAAAVTPLAPPAPGALPLVRAAGAPGQVAFPAAELAVSGSAAAMPLSAKPSSAMPVVTPSRPASSLPPLGEPAPAALPRVAPGAPPTMPRAEDLPHVRAATARATNGPADESGDPGGSHVVRTAAAAHHAGAVDVAAAPLAQPSPARAPILEVDLDTLVEKVQRKLLRSLASERERRGGFG